MRAQAKKRPNIPENMAELGQMLLTPVADSYSANFRRAVHNEDQIALLVRIGKGQKMLKEHHSHFL